MRQKSKGFAWCCNSLGLGFRVGYLDSRIAYQKLPRVSIVVSFWCYFLGSYIHHDLNQNKDLKGRL